LWRDQGVIHSIKDQIEQAFNEAGVTGMPEGAYDQFVAYLGQLLRWNARLSLTAIREPQQIIQRHFVECAFTAQHLPVDIESLLDYGSGAGLPGIAIAICRPEIRVTLAESHGKKAAFLREATRSIGFSGEVYEGRVEGMPGDRRFHAVTMRAVEKMDLAIPVAIRHTGRYLVLLATERSAPAFRQLASEFQWWEPIPLPKAEQRILAIGQRV
jgi:16S rRNA (guanine527-N7)-methyltransferase